MAYSGEYIGSWADATEEHFSSKIRLMPEDRELYPEDETLNTGRERKREPMSTDDSRRRLNESRLTPEDGELYPHGEALNSGRDRNRDEIASDDLRRRLNKYRLVSGERELYPDEKTMNTRRERNREAISSDDLRSRLNKNRRGNPRERRNYDSRPSGPNYTRGPGGLSPLRSPHTRNPKYNIMEMDNSRNHRYSKRHSIPSPGYGHDSSQRHQTLSSPSEPPRDKWFRFGSADSTPGSQTALLDSENEEGTPVLFKESPKGVKKSWSRRRLRLPSDNDDSDNESIERLGPIMEEDKVRLARREKDILYGMNTEAYHVYLKAVPKELRNEDGRVHPRTPEKTRKCSRRSWDAQVKIWKRRLHTWAASSEKKDGSEIPQNWDADVTGKSEGNETAVKTEEDDCVGVEEDDSFLDTFDLALGMTEEN